MCKGVFVGTRIVGTLKIVAPVGCYYLKVIFFRLFRELFDRLIMELIHTGCNEGNFDGYKTARILG